jgi:hypothetical protein
MNSHLSAEEISAWTLGDRTAERERHVGCCEACSGEIAKLESAIGEFRGAVRHWRDVPPPVYARAVRPSRAGRWVLAAAALALAIAAPVYRHRQEAAETARADAMLLEQVDAEVSQAVPRPMQPLVPLVSWNSSNEGNGDKQ